MTFQQAEQFLMSLSNLPRQEYMNDPKKCHVYLERTQSLLNILGNPEKKIPHYIHIAGTSGKGSVSSYLHSILLSDKKNVGLYTSPHPSSILERWVQGNKQMTKAEFAGIVAIMKTALDVYIRKSSYDPPSFFEITTAMTLYWFALKKVEWAVVETGCGGRFDSTNSIPYKDIAVITNIGLDHTEILGNTKEKIAYEKAGIIRACSVAITQENNAKVLKVIEQSARKQKAVIHRSKPIYTAVYSGMDGSDFLYKDSYFHTSVIGEHQIKNAILAIDTARLLGISEPAIQWGIKHATQPLRMEVYAKNPRIILDGAHNPDKIKTTVAAVELLRSLKQNKIRDIHLIIGFSENKNIRAMVRQLIELKPKSIMCTRNTVNYFRKVAFPKDIVAICREFAEKSCIIEAYMDPYDALCAAKKHAKKNDLILATGSLFMSGELRQYLTA